MRIHNKNNAIAEEIWLFLGHVKQDDKTSPRNNLDKMSLRLMIKPISKEVAEY